MIRLLPSHIVASIRKSKRGNMSGCGEVAMVTATGRAKCRSCGCKISKGEECLATVYDFHGGGLAGDPWTGTEIYIHEKCPKEVAASLGTGAKIELAWLSEKRTGPWALAFLELEKTGCVAFVKETKSGTTWWKVTPFGRLVGNILQEKL